MPDQNPKTTNLTIKFLKDGIIAFYPNRIKEFFGLTGQFPLFKSWGGFEDSLEFSEFLFNTTQTESLEDAVTWIKNYEAGKFEGRDIPVNIQELVEKHEAAKNELEKRQLAKELQQVAQKTKETPKKAVDFIYLKAEEIKVPELDEEFQKDLEARVKEAKKNPTAYTEKLTQIITAENTVDPATAKIVAVNLTDKLLGMDPALIYTQNPIHVLMALSDPNDPNLIKLIPDENERREFCRGAQNLALIQDHDNVLAKNLLAKILPEKLLNILYPDTTNSLPFTISDQEEGSHYTVNRKEFANSTKQISPFIEDLKTRAVVEIRSRTLKILDTSLSKLPWYSQSKAFLSKFIPGFGGKTIPLAGSAVAFESGMVSFFTAQGIPMLAGDLVSVLATPQFANVAVSSLLNFQLGSFGISRAVLTVGENIVGQAFGLNLGNFAIRLTTIAGEGGLKFALNIGTRAAVQAATTAAVETAAAGATAAVATGGITGAIASVTSALGAFAGPVGIAIGAVLGWLVGKVSEALINFIKKNKDFFKYAGLAMLAAGGFLGLWPLAAFGGLMFVGALGLGGLAAAGTSLATAGVRTLGFFGSVAVSISTTAVIIMLSFPVVVALILFIINSGAYIVPPKLSTLNSIYGGSSVSPYIDVQKVANPPGPFQNSQLPLTIEYTITIGAKKGALTNISIDDQCQVIKKGSSPACPSPDKKIGTDIKIPTDISPTQPFTFTYKRTFSSSDFKDSLTTDTINVTADTMEQAGAKASGSASVVIGNPPTGCFAFDNSWNANDKARETLAITKIAQATTYASTLCAGGPITLHRVGSGSGCGGGGGMVTGNIINIYDAGVNCTDFVTYYTLAHETGHIYSMRTNKYQLFLDSGAMGEGMICTYPNALQPSEDFAEMIALYYTRTAGSTKAGCMSGTLKTAYPLHWKFAHDNIFMENFGW